MCDTVANTAVGPTVIVRPMGLLGRAVGNVYFEVCINLQGMLVYLSKFHLKHGTAVRQCTSWPFV